MLNHAINAIKSFALLLSPLFMLLLTSTRIKNRIWTTVLWRINKTKGGVHWKARPESSGQVSQQEQLIVKLSAVKTKRQHTVRLVPTNRKKSVQTKDSTESNHKERHVHDTSRALTRIFNISTSSAWHYNPLQPPISTLFSCCSSSKRVYPPTPQQRARRQLKRNSVALDGCLLLTSPLVWVFDPARELVCCLSFRLFWRKHCPCCCTHHLDQIWPKRSLVENCLLEKRDV